MARIASLQSTRYMIRFYESFFCNTAAWRVASEKVRREN